MNVKEIEEQFPKAYKKLGDYLSELMLKSYPDDEFKEEIKKFIEESKDSLTEATLSSNSRLLFDFFDANETYVSVQRDAGAWIWDINEGQLIESGALTTRALAEEQAFLAAFNKLNNI